MEKLLPPPIWRICVTWALLTPWMIPIFLFGGCSAGIRIESELFKRTAPFDSTQWIGINAVFVPSQSHILTDVRIYSKKDSERQDGTFLLSVAKGKVPPELSFEVLETSPDGSSQLIETYVRGDTAHVWSRYKATQYAIEPISRRGFGIGSGFVAILIAVGAVWLPRRLGRSLLRRWRAPISVRGEPVEP